MNTRLVRFNWLLKLAGVLIVASICSNLSYGQSKSNRLERVSKVTTLVNYIATGQPPNGITEDRLRTVLELKLRSAGLRVLSGDEDRIDPDQNPYIYLEVSTLQTTNKTGVVIGWSYAVRLSARIFGNVPINRSRAPIELWSDSTMGVSGQESAALETERAVVELSESLLNAWLAANPRR